MCENPKKANLKHKQDFFRKALSKKMLIRLLLENFRDYGSRVDEVSKGTSGGQIDERLTENSLNMH